MTNPYNVQSPYQGIDSQMYQQMNAQNPVYSQVDQNVYPYQVNRQSGSLVKGVLTGAAVGFTGGTVVAAGVDYFKNRKPVDKNGEVSESFAKRVMDRIISKDYVAKGKAFFNQKINVLKHIDAAKTPEKFKKLMQKNKAYCSTLFDGISLETMCNTVTKENIKGKISAIKQRIEAGLSTEIQNIKDSISLCWDKENKKFVKPKGIDDKLFKIIKNTKNDINWTKVCKCGGITAGIFGVAALALSFFSRQSR